MSLVHWKIKMCAYNGVLTVSAMLPTSYDNHECVCRGSESVNKVSWSKFILPQYNLIIPMMPHTLAADVQSKSSSTLSGISRIRPSFPHSNFKMFWTSLCESISGLKNSPFFVASTNIRLYGHGWGNGGTVNFGSKVAGTPACNAEATAVNPGRGIVSVGFLDLLKILFMESSKNWSAAHETKRSIAYKRSDSEIDFGSLLPLRIPHQELTRSANYHRTDLITITYLMLVH